MKSQEENQGAIAPWGGEGGGVGGGRGGGPGDIDTQKGGG